MALRKPMDDIIRTAPAEPTREQLTHLFEAWGTSWAGEADLLAETARRAAKSHGAILECGSGLTTLLAAVYASAPVYALEHQPYWGRRIRRLLDRHKLDGATVVDAPLESRGQFDWYSTGGLPRRKFSLVICDGPPTATTKGGRYGLLPCMHECLEENAVILLDDYRRDTDKDIVPRWSDEFGVTIEEVRGNTESSSFAVLRAAG